MRVRRRYAGAKVRRDTLSIRRHTYRGTEGFKLCGGLPDRFGLPRRRVSIFSEHGDRLRKIRDLYRGELEGEDLQAATGAALFGFELVRDCEDDAIWRYRDGAGGFSFQEFLTADAAFTAVLKLVRK